MPLRKYAYEIGLGWLCRDEVRERVGGRIEEGDSDRGLERALARPSSPRRRRPLSRRPQPQERLGGGGASEPLMRPEHEVVREGVFEPSLQVADGERPPESKARVVFRVMARVLPDDPKVSCICDPEAQWRATLRSAAGMGILLGAIVMVVTHGRRASIGH